LPASLGDDSDADLPKQQQHATTYDFQEQGSDFKRQLSHRAFFDPAPLHTFKHEQLQRRAAVLHADVGRIISNRSKGLWAKLRSSVVKSVNLTGLARTLRALHSRSLIFVSDYEGFLLPSDAVDFVIQHSKNTDFEPFWLDAHCLTEEDARKLQRAFGFHSKTESLLMSRLHNASRYDREVSIFELCIPCSHRKLFLQMCSWFARKHIHGNGTEFYVTLNINVPRLATADNRRLDVPFVIVCCSDCVITSCWDFYNPAVSAIRQYMQKCMSAIVPLRPGVDMMFSVVLHCLSEMYLVVCDKAQEEVDWINEQRSGGGTRFDSNATKLRLDSLAQVIEDCTYLKRSLDPKSLIMQTLITRNMPPYLENSSDDIKDSASLFVSLTSSVQGFITHLDSVQANYLAMINLQVSEQSHAVNLLMEKLQIVSSVFLPLTLVSGIMGMNVPIPGSEINEGDNMYFYLLLAGFALTAILSTLWLDHSRKMHTQKQEVAYLESIKRAREGRSMRRSISAWEKGHLPRGPMMPRPGIPSPHASPILSPKV
jgi:Mg2+ and Co2+ transporter CorA